jgi:hypothetical protein
MTSGLRRACAHLTLTVFIVGLALPLASRSHLRWDDDLDCGSGILAVGHERAQIDVPQAAPSTAQEHCALCHWLRAVATAAPVPVAAAIPGFVAGTPELAAADASAPGTPVAIRSSRAPPARRSL